jgi:hypothetical protein
MVKKVTAMANRIALIAFILVLLSGYFFDFGLFLPA